MLNSLSPFYITFMKSTVAPWRPVRGDVVLYRDAFFFFQPHGNSCYLFASSADVGFPSRALHVPRLTNIRKPVSGKAEEYMKSIPETPKTNPSLFPRPPSVPLLEIELEAIRRGPSNALS